MNAQERTERFERLQEDLQVEAWRIAHEHDDNLIVSCAAADELVTSDLHIDGFTDDDSDEFSVEQWNEQLTAALDGAGLWFMGIAFPFTVTTGQHFLAVVALDATTVSYAQLILDTTKGKKPVRWEPLAPFEKLNNLLVVPRRLVTPQG